MLLRCLDRFLACCNSVSMATSYTLAFNILPKYPSPAISASPASSVATCSFSCSLSPGLLVVD